MQFQIALFVIGLLKKDISTYARFLQPAVVFYRRSRYIYVNPADSAVFMLYGINGLYGFQYIFYRIIDRILPRFNGQPLMTHILQGYNLPLYLLLRKLNTPYMLVFHMIGTVYASVYAVVGKIEGRKHHNPVPIKRQLYLFGQLIHFFHLFRNFAGQQHGRLAVRQTGTAGPAGGLHRPGLFQNRIYKRNIILIFLRIFYCFEYFLMIDKFLCFK